MTKARLFVGSSTESLDFANAVQEILHYYYHVTVWSQGVFKPSKTSLGSLLDILNQSDFGIFIFAPDDITIIRDKGKQAVRDNVIFELGLFIGRLGQERSFIITPQHSENVHLPTDLIGMQPLNYDKSHPNITGSLGPACTQVQRAINDVLSKVATKDTLVQNQVQPVMNEGDIIALLESWWPKREEMVPDDVTVHFAKLDKELSMPPGSTKQYIDRVAKRKSFKCISAGDLLAVYEYVLNPDDSGVYIG